MDRTKASNAQVATVDLYAGLLAEAEQERATAVRVGAEARGALEEWRKYFDQIREAVEAHSPGLAGGMGSYASLALTTAAVLREAGHREKDHAAREEQRDKARSGLIEALVAVGEPGIEEGMIYRGDPTSGELVSIVAARLATMQARISKKRLVLPRGSFQVQAAAVALVEALGDTHTLAGNHWKRLSAAVKALGKPGPSEAYRKAEHEAGELAIAYYRERYTTEEARSRLSDLGKVLLDAEAQEELVRVRKNPGQVVGL